MLYVFPVFFTGLYNMFETLSLIFLLSACAAFVQRVSGFGFGIFIMMFLPYIMPSYNEAVALSGLLSGSTAFFILLRNFKNVRWGKIPVVLLFNAFISVFVVSFMATVSGEILRRCLGAVLILLSLYFLIFGGRVRLSFESWWSKALVGIFSGVMGSMFAMPGPPVVLYGVNAISDKKEYMATMQAFWLLFNLVYLFLRSGGGYYTSDTPLCWAVGLAGISLGLLAGAMCFDRISAATFKKVVYLLMILSGMVALLK